MRIKTKIVSRIVIAALLTSSAAIFAAAQSGPARKENTRDIQSVPSTQSKQTPPAQATTGQGASDTGSPLAQIVDATSTRYSYEFTQPNFLVARILIEHGQDGAGKITFERKNGDPIVDPLDLSSATIARLKKLWEALRFLDSDVSYQTPKDYSHLGTSRLWMKQDTRQRQAEFNWTSDRDAFALVTEYRRIANQAIFVFDITLARENQPLEAPKLMDQFDAYLKRNEFADAEQLIPLLRELSTDERVPLMARNHAARILKKIDK